MEVQFGTRRQLTESLLGTLTAFQILAPGYLIIFMVTQLPLWSSLVVTLSELSWVFTGCEDLHELNIHWHVDGEELLDGVRLPQDQGVLQGEARARVPGHWRGKSVKVAHTQVVDMRWGVRDEMTDEHMTTVRSPTTYLCLLYHYVPGALHEWIERLPKIQHGTKLHLFWSPKVSTLWNLSNHITSVQVRLSPNPLWDRHSWTSKAEDNTCWDEEWRPPHGQMVGFTEISYIYQSLICLSKEMWYFQGIGRTRTKPLLSLSSSPLPPISSKNEIFIHN